MKAIVLVLLVMLAITAKSQFTSEGKTKGIEKPAPVDKGHPSVKPVAVSNDTPSVQPVAEGKAKTFIKQYIVAIEKAKAEPKANFVAQYLRKASQSIESIKKFDPAYNTKPLEEEVENMLKANAELENKQMLARQASSQNNDKQGTGMAGIFMGAATEVDRTGDADKDIENHKEKIKICNESIDRLIEAGSPDKENYEEYVSTRVSVSTALIKKLEEEIAKAVDKHGLMAYRDLIGVETYWNAAKRVFTNLPVAAQVHQLAISALQKTGGEEKIMENAKKNYLAMIKGRKFPVAVQNNTSLEQQFRKVFAARIPGETIIKVNIITADWTTVRHELTGILLARKQAAAIGVKLSDGTCHYYIYQIKQDYVGSQFVSFTEFSQGYQGEIFCDNIK